MKLDCSYVLKNIDGSDLLDMNENKEAVPATVGRALSNALLFMDPKETDGMKKARLYHLATKVYREETIEVDDKDKQLIVEYVGKAYGQIVVGQIYDMLGVEFE